MRKRQSILMLMLVLLVVVPLAMAPRTSKPKEIVVVGSKVIEERDASDFVTRQVVYGPGGPLWQVLSDGSSQYMHEDPRGNVVMLTEGAGSPMEIAGDVIERMTYNVLGKPVFQDASNQNKTDGGGNFLARSDVGNTLLFGGAWYDPETGNRGRLLDTDFGGFYVEGGRCYNPDEGRYITRSGPVGEEIHPDEYGRIKVQFSATAGNRYGLAGNAPVNADDGPMPQTREHILLARQVGFVPGDAASGRPTGRRTYEPIRFRKRVDSSSPSSPRSPVAELSVAAGDPRAADSFSFAVEREMKESGEKGGTADINIGVGEMQESGSGEFWFEDLRPGYQSAYGQTDWGFLRERASTRAAIAIPNLLEARKGANESAAAWRQLGYTYEKQKRHYPKCVYPLCGGYFIAPASPPAANPAPTHSDKLVRKKPGRTTYAHF